MFCLRFDCLVGCLCFDDWFWILHIGVVEFGFGMIVDYCLLGLLMGIVFGCLFVGCFLVGLL